MLEWLVVADDRSGALEVAGEMARSLGPVTVTVRSVPHDTAATAAVVDIGSRHLGPADGADRARLAAVAPARHHGHKIDSTLRGNWAHELVAVQRATGDRVLVVPAFPRVGRTCRGGVVHVDGVPIGPADARRAVSSPRPADHLVAAGAAAVVELTDARAVESWAGSGDETFAICDASTDEDLAAVAARWRDHEHVRLAGTAGSIAAAVAAASENGPEVGPVTVGGRVLVVCGSLHPLARTQIAALADRPRGDVTVLATSVPDGPSVGDREAEQAAAELASAARGALATGGFDMLVIVGGDTAAAVLGDGPMVVGGTVAPGMPWSRRHDGSGPVVVTKAGGFGHPTTLVELLLGRTRSEAR